MSIIQAVIASTSRRFGVLPNTGWRLTSTGLGTSTLVSSGPATLNGTAGLTLLVENNVDDGSYLIPVPFSVDFNGTSYVNNVYVGSNSYLTFGGGSDAYLNLSASNPNLDKIMIDASDNSYQRIYVGEFNVTPNRSYIVRYEGSAATTGTAGEPNIVWEITFYESTPTIYDINIGIDQRNGTGVSGIFTADSLLQPFM